MKSVKEELDVRDKWLGLRFMKKSYQPRPFSRKGGDGKHISKENIARETAKYLAEKHWGKKESRYVEIPKRIVGPLNAKYQLEKIELMEVMEVLGKFKRRKATGPDEIPMKPSWKSSLSHK